MALAVLMFVIAVICVLAGTWQIERFNQSVHDNNALKGNAHAAAVPLGQAGVPLVGHGAAPGRDAIRYQTVNVSGHYVAGPPQFVGDEYLNGTRGFYALSPLRVGDNVLLVVRGFVPDADNGGPPASITPPPTGLVHIAGRLQTATTKHDDNGALGPGEISAINPAEQSARLGAPVYNAYVTLNAHQPGTAGVRFLGQPDLSNPAGGAYEAQHFAYIVQWYLFALLALGAPFAIARAEVREARVRYLGIDPGREELGLEPAGDAGQRPQLEASASAGGQVVLKTTGTVAARPELAPERLAKARRLADRYGRSLGPDLPERYVSAAQPDDADRPSSVRRREAEQDVPVAKSAAAPHRSNDAYHGSYNDYLWQLALADGGMPEVDVPQPPRNEDPRRAAIEDET